MHLMFNVFSKDFAVEIFYDSFEDSCIGYALQDLKSDIGKACGRQPEINRYLPEREDGYIVAGCIENCRFRDFIRNKGIDMSGMEGEWEKYKLITFGDENRNLAICGSDPRGTMWGIYEFSEKYLGIDPLYFWTDNIPDRREELQLYQIVYTDSPVTCKFRGWFINDEDLLTGWRYENKNQRQDICFAENYQPILEKIIETALRLKQNLIIPCSHLNIMEPAQENIIRMITERGLFISQHHVEPLGVSGFTLESYWNSEGRGAPSYVAQPEKYEEIWKAYVQKWAKYPNVIWQLGLRGKGDQPVWHNDARVPDSMEDRGRLISAAISKQKEIVKEVLKNNNFYSTSTLWMEGMGLQKEGYLSFPENTIIINADFGPTQMWGEGFYSVNRNKKHKYGIYNHVAFWSCGPHLVQGTSPDKIYFNLKNAFDIGDTAYCITNAANFREMVMEIKFISRITWNINSSCVDGFLLEWSNEQFGEKCAAQIAKLYKNFFEAYHKIDNCLIPGNMILLDGMLKKVGLKLLQIIGGEGLVPDKLQNTRLYEFSSQEDFVQYYKNASAESLKRWGVVYNTACIILPDLIESRQQFFIDNIIVQLEIIIGLYEWVHNLSLASEEMLALGGGGKFEYCAGEAIFALEKILLDRRKAEQGKWNGWYLNDQLIGIGQLIGRTKEILPNQGG